MTVKNHAVHLGLVSSRPLNCLDYLDNIIEQKCFYFGHFNTL